MKHTDKLLTGGDGVSGQTGLEVRTNINDQFAVLMGDINYLPADFVFSTANLLPFANSVIEITHHHTLTQDITLPEGVILSFNGGSLLGSATITGTDTRITNPTNLKIFDMSLVFGGTWNEISACVQWFGGKSNPNIDTYTNDVMPILGKILEARWNVVWLTGNYYVGSTLEIVNPTTMHLQGAVRPDIIGVQRPTGGWVNLTPATPSEVTRLYSNLDINWFWIKSPYVNILGGTFDNSGAPQWNHAMIYINGNNTVDHCSFKQTVIGDQVKNSAPNQTGHYLFWESDGATIPGHLYSVQIEVDAQYQPIGIEIQSPQLATPGVRVWANGIHIKGRSHGCKKGIIHHSAGMSKIDFTCQTDYCLDDTEVDFYQADIKGYQIDLDMFVWDLSSTNELNPYTGYGRIPRLPVLLNATRVSFLGQSLIAYRLNQFHGSKGEAAMLVNSDSETRYFKDAWNSDVFFSELHNVLAGWDKKGSNQIDISGRIGTGYDFDTQLTEGTATINPNFSISDPENLVTPIGGATNFPTRYQFTTGADIENDFVEIVLTPEYTIDISLFFIYLMGDGTVVNRIQVIGTKTNDEIVVYNQNGYSESYRSKHFHEFDIKNTYKKLVIRLIGVTDLNKLVYILDFAGKAGRNKLMVVPEIHDFRYKFTGILTQTDTNAPVITEILRVTNRPVTTSRISTGRYYLYCDYALTENKTLPVNETTHVYQGVTFVGTIRMSWSNGNRFLIETWNTSGVLSDNILTNQYVSFNVGW